MKHQFGNAQSPPLESHYRRLQVHGTRCVEVLASGQDCGEADGFWTRQRDLLVHVVTADCVPILLARNDGEAVAALHAGWRGTHSLILDRFFASLPPELSAPGEWRAMLGPSIRAECYEVSEELILDFRARFAGLDPRLIEPSPRRLDLIAIHCAELERLGVRDVEIHPDCTFCSRDPDGSYRYRSYRRGDRSSRQYSWICR